MLNLSELAAKDHATIPVKHPVTGEPTGATITLAGPSSEEYLAARLRLAESRAGKETMTTEDRAQMGLDLLLDCIVGWEGLSMDGKKLLPFTRENAKTLLSDRKFYWLEAQIDTALVSVGNFIGA